MANYICPRCRGNDIYFAKRQEITGIGGIYGNKAKMVNTPLCRGCGEIANKQMNTAFMETGWFKILDKIGWAFLILFIPVCLLLLIFWPE